MSHRNRSKLHTPPPSNIPYPHICKYAQNNFQKHTELFLQNCCRCCIPQCMCYPLSWYQEIFPTKSGNMLIDHFISWYWGISALIGSLMNHRSSNTHMYVLKSNLHLSTRNHESETYLPKKESESETVSTYLPSLLCWLRWSKMHTNYQWHRS